MSSYKPTVMPKEDKKVDHLGAPGLQIPKNAENIKAFNDVSNVDAKQLNADLQAQDEKKTAPTPGIHLPDNPKDIKAFSDVSDEDAGALNAKLQK